VDGDADVVAMGTCRHLPEKAVWEANSCICRYF